MSDKTFISSNIYYSNPQSRRFFLCKWCHNLRKLGRFPDKCFKSREEYMCPGIDQCIHLINVMVGLFLIKFNHTYSNQWNDSTIHYWVSSREASVLHLGCLACLALVWALDGRTLLHLLEVRHIYMTCSDQWNASRSDICHFLVEALKTW